MNTVRDDRDLERLLRRTLTDQADTVRTGPAWTGAAAVANGHRRLLTRLAPLVAAAVVLGVGATVVAIEHSRPSTRPGTGRHNVPAVCSTALPQSWAHATRSDIASGAPSDEPLAQAPDGTTLVSRDFGTARDVVVVEPDGTQRRIYQVPSPDLFQVSAGGIDGNWAELVVLRFPRGADGIIPPVSRIVLVNLRDGARRTVFAATTHELHAERRVVTGAALYEGSVYYDLRPRFATNHTTIHRYDIATSTDRVVAREPSRMATPVVYPTGLNWSVPSSPSTVSLRHAIPAAVRAQLHTRRELNSLVSDGTSYAWIAANHRIDWYDRSSGTRSFVLKHPAQLDLDTVAGSVVLYRSILGAEHVLDVRTGATAAVPGVAKLSYAADGSVAITRFRDGKGISPATETVRLDTAALPELSC